MQIRKIIGVCGIRLYEERVNQLLNALTKVAKEHGYFVLVISSNSDSLSDAASVDGNNEFFDIIRNFDLSALIILSESLKFENILYRLIDIGHEMDIPVFCTDRNIESCYNIIFDYQSGFEKVVRHMVEYHNAKKVNMIAGIKGNSFSEERLDVYKKVLTENNIPVESERIYYGDFWEVPTRNAMKSIFESEKEFPDAIICANDAMAITACDELVKYGYNIPEDIMISGFDGIISSKYNNPPITTAIPDYDKLSESIIEEIERFDLMGIHESATIPVDFKLDINSSCSCCSKLSFDETTKVINKLITNLADCTWHTSAMNHMMTSTLDLTNIWDIARLLPDNLRLWSHIYTFAAVKTEVINQDDIPHKFNEMTVLTQTKNKSSYETPGATYHINNIMPNIERILSSDSDINIMVLRSLNSGKNVYGYVIEGFSEIDIRDLQRIDEFGMFLSDSIYSVLHSKKLSDLNAELKRANNEIKMLSEKDPMTDIYNRRGFYQKLDELIANPKNKGKYLYMLSLDMDNLKYINDNYGHSEGDFALIAIANALKLRLNKFGIFARYGGDEFAGAIVLDSNTNESLDEYQKLFQDSIMSLPNVKEKPYEISASIGIANHLIDDTLSIDDLVRAADRIMYREKAIKKKKRREAMAQNGETDSI
ncbi:MAG: GGDEF domain-containing protein [Lachnospiraceae bacterium]|nr:GGDEF domain-containing protein [Lachnospiraceae bacterium]